MLAVLRPPGLAVAGTHVVQVDDRIDCSELLLEVDVHVADGLRLGREVEPGIDLPAREVLRLRYVVEIGVEVAVEVEPRQIDPAASQAVVPGSGRARELRKLGDDLVPGDDVDAAVELASIGIDHRHGHDGDVAEGFLRGCVVAVAEVLQDAEEGLGAGALVAVNRALYQQDPVTGAHAGRPQLAALDGPTDLVDLDAAVAVLLDPSEPGAEFVVRRPTVELRVVERLAGALAGALRLSECRGIAS